MKSQDTLLKLQAFGMTMTGDGMRPLLLLKDETGEITLPVPLSPLEAGVALSQSSRMSVPATPHRISELLLSSLHIRITRCIFQDLQRGQLMVELELENHPFNETKLVLRADEAMSLVLHLEVPLFASREVIHKSRSYVAEMQGQAQNLILNPKILQRNHTYLM